jgi:hypothetical protein
VSDTWANFSGLDVCAWDEAERNYTRELKYYATFGADNVTSAPEMLENPNDQGQCGAWADLLQYSLAANGVSSDIIRVAPPATAPDDPNGYSGFAVKNIRFWSPPKFPGHHWPYEIWDPADYYDPDNTTPAEKDLGEVAIDGIPGQNNSAPQSKIFGVHFIVLHGTTYYDPSYGTTAASAADYTESAVDAWMSRSNPWRWRAAEAGDPSLVFTPVN